MFLRKQVCREQAPQAECIAFLPEKAVPLLSSGSRSNATPMRKIDSSRTGVHLERRFHRVFFLQSAFNAYICPMSWRDIDADQKRVLAQVVIDQDQCRLLKQCYGYS